MKYAKVAVENTVYDFDKLFDYAVPVEYIAAAVPGCRVLVPFGRGNQKRQGVIFAICDKTSYDKIKPFSSLLDDAPVLSAEMIRMAEWFRDNYYCTYYEAAKVMLPTGINMRLVTSYRASGQLTRETLARRDDVTLQQRKILEMFLSNKGLVLEKQHITEIMNLPAHSTIPDKLVEKGYLVRTDDAVRKIKDANI
ncbi:MAG: primosomal protein N', partial [Clostridia bacterium]|nr:primosomal protein N' [Clostridia bacterium]